MVRVFICDHEIVCQGLRTILSTSPDIDIVGVAYNGYQALEQIQKARPDVLLMDLKMPGINGLRATRLIRDKYPQVRVLVLTTRENDEWLFDAIRSGASGYLLKNIQTTALITAIKGTAKGKTYVAPDVAGKLFTHIAQRTARQDISITDSLKRREREVLNLLGNGFSNSDMARQLHLSEGTIRNYVSSILAKLNVSDRTQAAVLALQYGLVESRQAVYS